MMKNFQIDYLELFHSCWVTITIWWEGHPLSYRRLRPATDTLIIKMEQQLVMSKLLSEIIVFFNHNVFLRKLLRDCLSGLVQCRTSRDQGVLDPVDRPSGVSAFVAICWPPPTSAGCTTTSAAPYCAPVPLFPRIISPSLISDRTSVKPRGYDPWSHCWPLKKPIWMVIVWFRYTLLCKQPRSRRNEQAVQGLLGPFKAFNAGGCGYFSDFCLRLNCVSWMMKGTWGVGAVRRPNFSPPWLALTRRRKCIALVIFVTSQLPCETLCTKWVGLLCNYSWYSKHRLTTQD